MTLIDRRDIHHPFEDAEACDFCLQLKGELQPRIVQVDSVFSMLPTQGRLSVGHSLFDRKFARVSNCRQCGLRGSSACGR